MEHRHDADGEIARDAAADLEEANAAFGGRLLVPGGQFHHVLDAGLDRVDLLDVAGDDVAGVHVAKGGVFPTRDEHRQVLLHRGEEPGVLGIDLVILLQHAGAQNFVHELMREETLACLIGANPFLQHGGLDAAHGLHLGDAGIGDAIHVALQQGFLVSGSEVAVVGHALVVVVRDEIEDILFQIRAGTADRSHLVLADHLGQRQTQFRRTHGPGERDEHLAATGEVGLITLGRIDQRGGIEVTVVVGDKIADRRAHDGSLKNPWRDAKGFGNRHVTFLRRFF